MSHDPVVLLVPVLRRPHRITPFIESVASATDQPYRILFLCTDEDEEEINAIRAVGADFLLCGAWQTGDYARKINTGYRESDEPLIFLGADDLRFHPGWLPAAINHLSERIQVVGTNDLGNIRVMAGRHATHSLLTRTYADRYGTIDRKRMILFEGYPHTFTDDEFVQTAMSRGMFAFAADSVVEHLHPNWGKGKWDDVYKLSEQSIHPGRRVFNRRRRLWMNGALQQQMKRARVR